MNLLFGDVHQGIPPKVGRINWQIKMISQAFVIDDGHDVAYQSRTILPKRTQHLITRQTVQWQLEN